MEQPTPVESSTSPKVAKEVAEAEFLRFVEINDLDIDESTFSDEDKEALAASKDVFVKSVMSGKIAVTVEGDVIQHLSRVPQGSNCPETITFREPQGNALLASDKKKLGHDMSKFYAIMTNISNAPTGYFSKLYNRDLKVSMTIATLFLG